MKGLFLTIAIGLIANHALACGVWRWPVKTGTDQDVSKVNLDQVHSVSIADLISIPLPFQPPTWNAYPQHSRIAPTELQVDNIRGTIIAIRHESDQDYHMLVENSAGKTMVTEIPAPRCVGSSSPFLSQIAAARAYLSQNWNGQTKVNIPASITGVAFFDFPHAGGSAPNGIELHPVLKVQFLK